MSAETQSCRPDLALRVWEHQRLWVVLPSLSASLLGWVQTDGPGVLTYTVILALRRQKQMRLCKFQASLVYIASSVPVRTMYRDPVSKKMLMFDSW